jgi:prevent-host-death family protein
MPRIDLSHLRTHAPEVVQDVETNRTQYVITSGGEPVAMITPYAPVQTVEAKTEKQYWEEFSRLSAEIGAACQDPRSAAELVRELRR